jgi:hypothetical protein
MVGAMLDRAVLSRVADSTIRNFIGRLAQFIERSSTEDQQGAVGRGLPWV